MKRITGISGIVLGCGLFLSVSASASSNPPFYEEDTVKGKMVYAAQLPAETVNLRKIDIDNVPLVVKSAIAARYSAYVVEEAFIEDNSYYKLMLKKRGSKLAVYYSGNGEFLRKETCNFMQGI